ncbi:hypothetical protein RIE95_04990 [Acidithiobacillus thiooxidans]|nr:hypothetical protein [Acidithiobacillus thiooxidans]MDR7926349.1 hypothetical protein [Acidithiobacillus thiooxidans]
MRKCSIGCVIIGIYNAFRTGTGNAIILVNRSVYQFTIEQRGLLHLVLLILVVAQNSQANKKKKENDYNEQLSMTVEKFREFWTSH